MYYREADSHSSGVNNKRLQYLLFDIDNKSKVAHESLNFYAIQSYLHSIEQFYINVREIYTPKEVEESDYLWNRCNKIIEIIEYNPKCRTKKALKDLLNTTKLFNLSVINSLHTKNYFIRMGKKQIKGLNNIMKSKESIFTR